MKQSIPEEILKGHTAVVGMTGSGKSSTEKLIIEQVVATNPNARVCVLDTLKSDWWGITSSASGKSPGLPFKILGGPRGHVPLHSSAGKVIGQLVGTGKLPLSIVDMADFEAGGIQRFFVDFAQSLWRHARGVVYIVIEEAHEIAPKERAGFGAENMAIHWAKKLATGSRTKGIRLIVATQRTQALHNAVLGSCQTVIAHQLMFDADQTPVLNWVKSVNKTIAPEVASSIASLPTGTGWICSGRAKIFEKVHFPKFKTYDNTATPDGDSEEIDVKMAPVDQDELRAIIGDAVKQAEADDPAKLRAEITKLTRELAIKPAGANPEAITAAQTDGYQGGYEYGHRLGFKAGFDEALSQAGNQFAKIKTLAEARAADLVSGILAFEPQFLISKDILSGSPPSPVRPPAKLTAPTRVLPQRASSSSPAASGNGALSGPQREILASLAWWSSMGHEQPSKAQVAAVAGWKVKGSHLRNRLAELSSKGLITYPRSGFVALTDRGAEAAPSPDTSRSLIDRVNGMLSGPQQEVFAALLRQPRDTWTRQILGEAIGWDALGSHLRNRLAELSSMEIIEYPSRGEVALQEWVRP